MIETSPVLREIQKKTLQVHNAPSASSDTSGELYNLKLNQFKTNVTQVLPVRWSDHFSELVKQDEGHIPTLIICQELFDALPV